MKLTRRQLNEALGHEASRPTPAPSKAFVDALERRILGDDAFVELADLSPIRRVHRAGVAVAIAAVSVAAASVAAALPEMRNGHARIVTASNASTVVTTSTTSTTSKISAASIVPVTPVAPVPLATEQTSSTATPLPPESDPGATAGTTSTMPSTIAGTIGGTIPSVVTVTSTSAPTPSTTAVPTTSPTEPPTNPALSTAAPPPQTTSTSTTEVTVPASLSLQCAAASASSIRCTWSKASDSRVAGYRLLRGAPGGPGRVFSTGPGDSGYTDIVPVSGVKYSFVVHAVDANGTSLGHSQLVYVTCCTP